MTTKRKPATEMDRGGRVYLVTRGKVFALRTAKEVLSCSGCAGERDSSNHLCGTNACGLGIFRSVRAVG